MIDFQGETFTPSLPGIPAFTPSNILPNTMPSPKKTTAPPAASLPAPQALSVQDVRQRLNLTVDLIPRENSNRPGTPLAASRITIHNTDNDSPGADARAHAKYMKGQDAMNRKVSWHFTVDDGAVFQSLPVNEGGWHAGSHAGNTSTIGIEICQNQGIDQAAANTRAALLTALMLHELGIPLKNNVVQHHHWSGKDCPMLLRHPASRWAAFLGEVAAFHAALQSGTTLPDSDDHAPPADLPSALPPSPPPPGSKLTVTASSLNVRLTPSIQGAIVGSMKKGDVVDWLETSSDQYWAKVQNPALTGWSSRRFLLPVAPVTPPAPPSSHESLLNIASSSAIARYEWPGRGVAPLGYIKGMALVYARLYCKLKAGDPAAMEMARANSGDEATDALAHYVEKFKMAGMDNESSGVSTLRHLVVLMVGLGMRESSGRYCEGRDKNAQNTTANTAEAGLFQTSFNARSAHLLMPPLFQKYQSDFQTDPAIGFSDIFKEGVNCKAQDWQNFGTGPGKDFQELSKKCPAFAAEFCALGLRNIRKHWGPINNRAAEIRPECNQLLMRVEQAIESAGLCPV
jgi:hypothetical protein